MAVSVGCNEIPFKGPDVACYDYFQVFEFPIGKSVEESLHPATDIFLPEVALTERIRSHRRMVRTIISEVAGDQIRVTLSAPRFLRKGWGIMGFLKNNPRQSSQAYPILSDASGFPGSKIGDTFDSCNIAHGPLKRGGSSGVHPLALDLRNVFRQSRELLQRMK